MIDRCPKCGCSFEDEEDDIVICPTCGIEGSTKCCNPAGRGSDCVKCEEAQ